MAMRAPTATPEQLQQIQENNPLRQRALEATHAHHPNSQVSQLSRLHQEIADLPTREIAVVKRNHLIAMAQAKTTRPLLRTDPQGRPYLKIRDDVADTLLLVERVVAQYFAMEKCYPDEVVLSSFHYFTFGMKWSYFFIPGTTYKIPYVYEGGVNFDVMARGTSIYQY